MKMIRHLLGSLLVGCLTSSAHAQIINSLDIHGKMLPGKDPYSTRFSVVLDSSQLSDSDLDKTDHPLHPIKAKIDALLSRYGTIETGEESGFGRRAYQVDLDLIRKDGNVVEGNIALASVLGLRSAFLPYQQNLYSKTLDGGVPYIELRGKYAEDINHFFLCVVLDYKSHVEGSLSLTNKLTRLLQENCSRRWSQEELNASFQTLRSEVRLSTAEEHVDFKSERNNFSPFGLEEDLFECQNMTTTGLSEMVKLGWFASADPLQAIEDCRAFVYGLFFHLDQDIPKIFDPRVLRESISPYYRSLLQSIIEKSGKLVVKEKNALEAELSAQLVGLARLSEGFTQSRVQASSFNLAAFQKAAADPKSSAYETLGALLSPGKNHKDPLRLEFAAAKDQDLEAYEQRLSEALTQSCDFEAFKPACVRSGLAHLEERVAKIKIAYGPNEDQVFDGYYLFVSKNTEDKDSEL